MKKGSNSIAISIIVAGLIIAGSIFLTGGGGTDGGSNVAAAPEGNNSNTASINNFRLPESIALTIIN